MIRQRVAADEPFGEANDAELEALGLREMGRGAERHLDASTADVDHHGLGAADVDAVAGREMNQPRFFSAGDHADADPRLALDRSDEIAAVVGFARRGGGARQDFVDLVRGGQAAEFRQGLEPSGHGRRGQAAAVEAAGPEANHFLFSINDFEREIRTHLHHDHVDRIGADVDGGYSHEGGGAARPARGFSCFVTWPLYTACSVESAAILP